MGSFLLLLIAVKRTCACYDIFRPQGATISWKNSWEGLHLKVRLSRFTPQSGGLTDAGPLRVSSNFHLGLQVEVSGLAGRQDTSKVLKGHRFVLTCRRQTRG